MFRPVFELTRSHILQHGSRETHSRHVHRDGFIAVVLRGDYSEIGDTGHWRVRPGHALVHNSFEGHYNVIGARGADVLLLPLPHARRPELLIIPDVDQVVRLSDKDKKLAAQLVLETGLPASSAFGDWPDQLAEELRMNSILSISEWAERQNLSQETVSRGFKKAYQCTPKRFRLRLRTQQALRRITSTGERLLEIAHDCGFADQAHMTRSVAQMTGFPPSALRQQSAPTPGK